MPHPSPFFLLSKSQARPEPHCPSALSLKPCLPTASATAARQNRSHRRPALRVAPGSSKAVLQKQRAPPSQKDARRRASLNSVLQIPPVSYRFPRCLTGVLQSLTASSSTRQRSNTAGNTPGHTHTGTDDIGYAYGPRRYRFGPPGIQSLRQARRFLLRNRLHRHRSCQMEAHQRLCRNPDPRHPMKLPKPPLPRRRRLLHQSPRPAPRPIAPPMIAPISAPPTTFPAERSPLPGPFTLNMSDCSG